MRTRLAMIHRLREAPGASVLELMEHFGLSKQTVQYHLNQLRARGLVVRQLCTEKPELRAFRYRLAATTRPQPPGA